MALRSVPVLQLFYTRTFWGHISRIEEVGVQEAHVRIFGVVGDIPVVLDDMVQVGMLVVLVHRMEVGRLEATVDMLEVGNLEVPAHMVKEDTLEVRDHAVVGTLEALAHILEVDMLEVGEGRQE